MEIHPPHGPIHSWQELAVQLATITAGILIALSLDGVREWRHERALVREARENLSREIAANLKEVDGENKTVAARQAKVDALLAVVEDAMARKPSNVHQIDIGANIADLNAAGWQTAERMGALAHMDYGEVQRYSKLYSYQQLFADQQHRTVEHAIAAITAATGDPFSVPIRDLEILRERLRQLRADLLVEEQFGTRLSEEYRKVLP